MNKKLYVDNMATTITYLELMELFSAHGNVAEVNLPVDRASGRSRGFGLVTMETPEGARAAIAALHGKAVGTQTLAVSEARPSGGRTTVSDIVRTPGRSYRLLY